MPDAPRTPAEDAANLAKLQNLETGQKETAPAIIDPLRVAKTPPKGGVANDGSAGAVINPLDVAKRAAMPRQGVWVDPQSNKPQGYPPPDPNRVVTVGEEQLARSAEIEKVGAHRWMHNKDDRPMNERPKMVPGVGFTESPQPSVVPVYPPNWATMSESDRASWLASSGAEKGRAVPIDPLKVAETPPKAA